MKRRPILLRFLVVGTTAALSWSACDSIDFATIDWDGDGVPDQNDAFPVDPNENTDSDGDGVGDNGDAFPQDPDRSTPADGPVDNANDNAAPPDVGNVNDNENTNDNQNANDNQNVNDNAAPDPPSGGRR